MLQKKKKKIILYEENMMMINIRNTINIITTRFLAIRKQEGLRTVK